MFFQIFNCTTGSNMDGFQWQVSMVQNVRNPFEFGVQGIQSTYQFGSSIDKHLFIFLRCFSVIDRSDLIDWIQNSDTLLSSFSSFPQLGDPSFSPNDNSQVKLSPHKHNIVQMQEIFSTVPSKCIIPNGWYKLFISCHKMFPDGANNKRNAHVLVNIDRLENSGVIFKVCVMTIRQNLMSIQNILQEICVCQKLVQ